MSLNVARHGGQIHRAARELKLSIHEIADYSASLNPLGPPESVREALLASLQGMRHYPDSQQWALKQELSRYLGATPESLLVVNGATEFIDMAMRYLKPSQVWVFDPAFSEYRAAAHRNNIRVRGLPLDNGNYWPPWERVRREAQPGDLVIWNNPHNPSGKSWERTHFIAPLLELAARGVFVLVDESFIDFLEDGEAYSARWEALQPGSHIIVLRSLTKFFAIAGLRIGYAIGDPAWLNEWELLRDGWSVGHLAQQAAIAGLKDRAFYAATHQWLHAAQRQISSLWASQELYVAEPTSVNFFLLGWRDENLAGWLARRLFQQGILVRVCEDFGGLGERCWRVAILSEAQNMRLYAAVRELLVEQGVPNG